MKINGKTIKAKRFAFDGCHKMYILETREDYNQAKAAGYGVYSINAIQSVFEGSCPLRFIHNWSLTIEIVNQGDSASFC